MLKLIPPYSYDFGEPVASIIGYTGKSAFSKSAFRKVAGEYFIDVIEREPPRSGEVPVYLIALGAGEYFGPNRNGDYFSSKACQAYHHTFVKHAKFFRNHQNTDPKISFGIVKASQFNPKAGRIELLVYLNGTKEAATRNEGLIADKELEKLENDEDIPVSMSCKVPYDVCSGCGHKSASRVEYCDDNICTKYGGLRHNIGRTYDDGHTLCALNPECDWFDISHVHHPADRIAYVLGTVALEKKANGSVTSGAHLAELIKVAEPIWYIESVGDTQLANQLKLLEELVLIESLPDFNLLSKIAFESKWPSLPRFNNADERLAFIYSSIKAGCLLPFKEFCSVINLSEEPYTLGGFTALSKQANLHNLLQKNPYIYKNTFVNFDSYFSANKSRVSILPEDLVKRGSLLIESKPLFKVASDTSSQAMQHYCLYKLAFADYWLYKNINILAVGIIYN